MITPQPKHMRLLATLAMSVAVGQFMGCSNASNVLDVSTERPASAGMATDQRVLIGSKALGHDLTYGEVLARREGSLLRAQVALENKTTHTVNFEYRWEWTDADGFQLGDTLSNWQPGVINGNEHKLLSSTGPGPAAANFRLNLRRPGD